MIFVDINLPVSSKDDIVARHGVGVGDLRRRDFLVKAVAWKKKALKSGVSPKNRMN